MKIYIHHFFTNSLFYKLAHNTTDRVFNIKNNIGNVFFKFNNIQFEFEFNPILNDNTDGLHLLDFFGAHHQHLIDDKFKDIKIINGDDCTPFLKRFVQLLENKKNWIISIFRTEKLLFKMDSHINMRPVEYDIEFIIEKLNKNKIVFDNVFLNDLIETKYPNYYYAFTNTIFQWNEIIGIRWYYEFNNIFNNLKFDYDVCYSVRNHKKFRVEVLKKLKILNIPTILLQRTDSIQNSDYNKFNNLVSDIEMNSIKGNNDFSNLSWITGHEGIGMDLFFRVLNKAKLQILDESWAYANNTFNSQYLSEKTFGLILAGIPFISTHTYPLDILEKILKIEKHPFYKETFEGNGNPTKFIDFINLFMQDFDNNYEKCKIWSLKCRTLLMNKLETENSLLDLILINFEKEKKINSKLL